MKDIDAFLNVFGNITVFQVVEVVMAVGFIYFAWKKIEGKIVERHDAEQERDEKLKNTLASHEQKINEALDGIHKYPEWRQQSLQVQKDIETRMQTMSETLDKCVDKLREMEDLDTRRTRNQLRYRLLQSYRFYTNPEKNPSRSWTRMESEAFWEMFRDYEDAGGDGYMHTEVQPAMERLFVVEIGSPMN